MSRPDLPDLTLVDLPGIVRVPIGDQPPDIYDQISKMIRHYIEPEESIILNVLSAQVDFPTCESIVMSAKADKSGMRTLAVVTKSDRAPEGLFEKVTENAVPIGLGYVLVCNRANDSMSHDDARDVERDLFTNHSQLSQLPPSQLGIPALSSRLTSLLAERVSAAIPKIKTDIDAKLNKREAELAALPRGWSGAAEALGEFVSVTDKRRHNMRQLLQGENDEFPDDKEMHYAPRLHEIFKDFGEEVRAAQSSFLSGEYTKVCALAMEEARGVSLSNVNPPRVMHLLVKREVANISAICARLADTSCDYVMEVSFVVARHTAAIYPLLVSSFQQAIASVMENARQECQEYITGKMSTEANFVFTNNPDYMDTVNKTRASIKKEMEATQLFTKTCGAGTLVPAPTDKAGLAINDLVSNDDQAVVDVQVNMHAYWKVVLDRLIDDIPMKIRRRLEAGVLEEVDANLRTEVCSQVEDFMRELPEIQNKRMRLHERIKKLKEAAVIMKTAATSFY